MELIAHEIRTSDGVEKLRQIRNSGREGFAHHVDEISETQQAEWWAANGNNVKAWLFQTDKGDEVGFGLLRPREDEDHAWWFSVAVLPEFQGLGYGKQITDFCARSTHRLIYSQVRRDNIAGQRIHAGWLDLSAPGDELITYVLALVRPPGSA